MVASLNIHPGAIIFSKFKIRKTRPTIGTMRRNRKAFKYLLKLRNIRRGSVYVSIFVDTGLWNPVYDAQISSAVDVAKLMIASARNCQFYSIIVKPSPEVPKSKVPKPRPKGLGLTLKSHGPPPPHNS